MIHKLGQIVREQFRGVWHVRACGAAVPPAIERQEMEVARELFDHAIPDALIERERMDQRKPRSIRPLRGPQRIDDRATVGGRENSGPYVLHRPGFKSPSPL